MLNLSGHIYPAVNYVTAVGAGSIEPPALFSPDATCVSRAASKKEYYVHMCTAFCCRKYAFLKAYYVLQGLPFYKLAACKINDGTLLTNRVMYYLCYSVCSFRQNQGEPYLLMCYLFLRLYKHDVYLTIFHNH